MIKQFLFLISFFLLVNISCKKNGKNEPDIKRNITLSSEILGSQFYYSYGYSFEKEIFISTLNPPDIIDIYLVSNFSDSQPTHVQFATKEIPGTTYGFHMNAIFTDSLNALTYFNNYRTAVNLIPPFTILTDTIRKNQIWTFSTWKDNYVKILVKNVRLVSTSSSENHIEVDIKYFIQRDGSAIFTE